MSKLITQEEINEIEESFEDDITETDYCFVFDTDGEIKSIMLPDNVPFIPPETISKILSMLGIGDIAQLESDGFLH
jgi:hypothetical protein